MLEILLERAGVTDVACIPMEMISEELEELKATIANEELWALGSRNREEEVMHLGNLAGLKRDMEELTSILHEREESNA